MTGNGRHHTATMTEKDHEKEAGGIMTTAGRKTDMTTAGAVLTRLMPVTTFFMTSTQRLHRGLQCRGADRQDAVVIEC